MFLESQLSNVIAFELNEIVSQHKHEGLESKYS